MKLIINDVTISSKDRQKHTVIFERSSSISHATDENQ